MARIQAVRSPSAESHALRRPPWPALLLAPGTLVVLITLLGAALRLYRLGAQSLWLDEVITATARSHRTFADLITWTRLDDQMPLYNAVTWGMARFGRGEAFLRFPAAVAGTLTIPAIYWLGRATFGKRAGLTAAVLMAVMPFAVWYSQEARPYAFLMLFTILQLVFAYRAVHSPSPLDWGALAVVTLLNLYTHYMAIAATAAVCAFIVFALAYRGWRQRRDGDAPAARRQWLLTGVVGLLTAVVIAIGYLPWLPTLRNFLHRPTQGLGRFAGVAHSVGLADITGLLGSFDLTGLLVVLLLVGIVASVAWIFSGRVLEASLPLISLALPLAGLAVVLRGGIFVILPRYLSFLFPTALLLTSFGLVTTAVLIGAFARRNGWLVPAVSLALVVLAVAQLAPQLVSTYAAAKDDYRDAALTIAAAGPPDSVVLAMGRYSNFITISLGYYLQDQHSSIQVIESKAIDDQVTARLTSSHGTVWAALFTSYAPNDLEQVSTSGLEVRRFPGITLIRLPASSQTPLAQAEALLRWGSGFEPELAASIDLLQLLQGDQSVVRAAISTGGHWALGPGASVAEDSVLLDPGGATGNATFTLRQVTGGEHFAVRFRYANGSLHGEQRVVVSAHDRSGRYLDVFPTGDGYLCPASAGDGQGAFAFTIPKGTDAVVVWLRATGTGRAEFGPITVYQMS